MSLPSSFDALSPRNPNDTATPSVLRNMLKFFLVAPFRVFTRLLSLDRLLDREEELMSSSLTYSTEGGSPMVHMASPPPSNFHHSLGPWSFFASGYAISLFAMVRWVRRSLYLLHLTLFAGFTLEPHSEHRRSKSASAPTPCSFQSQLTHPLGSSSSGPSLSFSYRSIVYLLQSGSSVTNYVLYPQITSPLVNFALASLRLLSYFLMGAIEATRRLGGSQGNGRDLLVYISGHMCSIVCRCINKRPGRRRNYFCFTIQSGLFR
jgi:hypothetical protein